MTIQVIGGGAVGLLIASYLQEQFGQVEIRTRRDEQARCIHKNGVVRYSLQGEKIALSVNGVIHSQERLDLVVIATKYHELPSVFPLLRALPRDIPLLFVQNGLAHYEQAMQLPQQTILFGSAQFGAERKSDYEVIHRGVGVLKLALAKGKPEEIVWLKALGQATFPVEWLEDAEAMLFEKALLNCFVNPLTAILQVKNGELVKNKAAYSLLQSLYAECMLAFPHMKEQFPFQAVQALCERTAANTSSMLADRLANRQTEVDTIVGAVLQKAKKQGAHMPVLQTLYQLLQAMQQESGVGR